MPGPPSFYISGRWIISRARVEEQRDGGKLYLKIAGYIGENSDLFAVDLKEVNDLTVDLSQITYINSIGVKHWILWTMNFNKKMAFRLTHCPPLVVNQINIVAGFLPKNGTVESFYVPYYCGNCSSEAQTLLEQGKSFKFATEDEGCFYKLPDEMNCPRCKKSMEPDVLESKYFDFLTRPVHSPDS